MSLKQILLVEGDDPDDVEVFDAVTSERLDNVVAIDMQYAPGSRACNITLRLDRVFIERKRAPT